MQTKQCPRCKEYKTADEFYKSPKGYCSSYCQPCTALYSKERKKENKLWQQKNKLRRNKLYGERARQRRKEFMAGKSCVWCGEANKKLDLHHVDSKTKVGHTSSLWRWSEERRLAELRKCIILCHPCHMRHHNKRPIIHGTARGYWQSCRCEKCKEASRMYEIERKAKKLGLTK